MVRVLSAVLAATCLAAGVTGQEPPKPDVVKIHQQAFAQPFDYASFTAYLKTLPRDGEYYVVEGDIALTEDEVRTYLVGKSGMPVRADAATELLLNLHDGKRDFYESVDQRSLTYAVDRASFPTEAEYKLVVTSVGKAAAEWEAACPDCRIRISHAADQDTSPAAGRVSFIVRGFDVQGAYIALAFFPHDPPARRILKVDPSYFTTSFDRVGVFRHELGHVLGYRHEHIRGITGCGFEDNRWVPLTPYDPHSVMHYFCGGAGGLSLALSDLDRSAHTRLYALPQAAGLQAPFPTPSERVAKELALYRDAVTDPFDPAKREAYLRSLPRQDDYYILEGDLRMTADEVLSYLVAQGDAPSPAERGAELLVNLHAGARDFYRDPDQRNLTYAIDRQSFPDEAKYKAVAEAVQQATRDWVAACSECKLRFTYVPEQDPSPSPDKVNFTVRYQDAHGDYIALGFFPHDPPVRRHLDVDPSYFTTSFDRVGVFRHELGHILGYRHEHIRDVPGCYREDDAWQPLTAYDSKSVMHYFCGGKGDLKLELTALDREGHHKLYALPAPATAGTSTLVVRFEGGEVADNALAVLRILQKEGALPIGTHTVAPGESLETILKSHLELPGYPASMTKFVRLLNDRLNDGLDPSNLQVGSQVRYPNLQLVPYEFATKLDPEEDEEQIEQIQEKWPHVFVGKQEQQKSPFVRVVLKGYEMRVPIADSKRLTTAARQINALGSRNIVVYARKESKGQPAYFGHHDAQNSPKEDIRTFWRDRQPVMPAHLQGALGALVGMADLPQGWNHPCEVGNDCPEIVLIDNPVSPHPDLAGAVFTDSGVLASDGSPVDGQNQKVEVDNDLPESEHGTHLAGIIASDDNDFGLVGVHPGVRLYSWNWNELHDDLDRVATRIGDREEEAATRGALQIYVFATQWKSNPDAERRLTDDILARKLSEEKVLVIAAAGQPDPKTGAAPEDLTITRGYGPMNLGDQENVVVVTACSPCEGPTPRIAPWANYSKSRIVQLAAPGENIPSTVGHGHYATASGTSQATAFVAGVASAMACYYPRSYERGYSLKARLQVTSRPLAVDTGSEADAAKIATGILDEKLAMLDPSKDFIQRNGQDMLPLAEPFQWEASTIKGRTTNLTSVSVLLSRVYRIVHKNGRAVLYIKGEHKGEVERIGPLKLSASELTKSLFRQGGNPVAINDFEDLLLSRPHKTAGDDQ